MTYDQLGRMIQRQERDLTSTWTYDNCTMGIGKLCTESADNGYSRSQAYDSIGRPSTLSVTVDTAYMVTTGYDSAGRIASVAYPTGFAVTNSYNSYGYLYQVQGNDPAQTVFWHANTEDAVGHVTTETLGNGLAVTRTYDALFRMTAVSASGTGGTAHSQTFTYDPIGNVTQRVDLVQSVTENLAYDSLNRLNSISGPTIVTRSFDFDSLGNIAYKSDVGAYSYGSQPHAATSVTGYGYPDTVTANYTYDANGNLTGASGTFYAASGPVTFSRALSYMSFGLPLALTHVQGGSTYSYTYAYNAQHERMKLVTVRPDDTLTTIYLHPAGSGALLFEKETHQSTGQIEYKHYVNGGSGLVGVYVTKSSYMQGDGPGMRYYHRDHLGSVAVITNDSGAYIERLAYEPFGERRNTDGSAEDRKSPIVGATTDRGFTAHEHLDEMMLIHMNGRIYDPILARFMTPDTFVQSADNLQSYNRYSYVLNNPLMYTDPSGYLSLNSIFDTLDNIIDNPRALIGIGVGIWLGFADFGWLYGPNVATAGIFGQTLETAVTAGFVGGTIATGDLKGGLNGAFSAGLFFGAGELGGGPLLHAAAGCLSSAVNDGKCGAGALAAGSAEFLGSRLPDLGPANLVRQATIGGIAATLGGGKFANGAMTAGFAYLFNCGLHPGTCMRADSDPSTRADGYHQYEAEAVRPDGSNLTRDEIFNIVRRCPTPFQCGAPVNTGDITYIPGLGRVLHVVDESNYAVFNIALDGHTFYPGYVYRNAAIIDGVPGILTYGEGTGAFGPLLRIAAPSVWAAQDKVLMQIESMRK